MERIVFLDRRTCKAPLRSPRMAHEWEDFDLTRPNEIAGRIASATIAITNKVPLREADLKSAPALRLIAVAATGVDIVDVEYCTKRGISVVNVPHYTGASVPEHVFMLILALRRNLTNYSAAVDSGLWARSPMFSVLDYPVHNIAGSTLGIIGYGELGKAVEKIGKAFGMNVLIAERKHAELRPGRTRFEDVLGSSDVVTLHAPLNPATRKLIGSAELTRMRPNALLINTARGGLVDELALAQALRSGLIAGAGLDVLSEEPPAGPNPLLELNLSNLLITPHIGWASEEAVSQLAEQLIENIEAFVAGAPRNVVN
jgi:glycerate dehydrogenase